MILWAILPIILIIILLLSFRLPLFKVAPIAFTFASFIVVFIWKLPPTQLIYPLSKGLLLPFDISLIILGALTYLMVLTDSDIVTRAGMMQVLANGLITPFLLYYSAFIGAFGSFLTGSATVSNLLLSPLQYIGAQDYDLNSSLVLVLQLTGAAAGNMIALPKILAIKAAVNFDGSEGEILKVLILPSFIYLLLATFVSLALF